MTVLRLAGLAVGWGVALLWTTRGAAWLRGMSRLPDLLQQEVPPVGGTKATPVSGAVSVIVPARNEARDVDACLRSLLASKGVGLEVIAVDDRSMDETGAVMEALRDSAVRYAVEHVRELPAGWLGKPHAMATWSGACQRGVAAVHRCRCGLRGGHTGSCSGVAGA